MSHIAEALQNAQYLKPAIDSLRELAARKRFEDNLKDYIAKLDEAQNKIQATYNQTGGLDASTWEQGQSPVDKLTKATPPETTPGAPANIMGLTANPPEKPIPPEIPTEQPSYEVLGDYAPAPTLRKKNLTALQQLTEFQKEMLNNPDVNPAQGVDILQRQITANQPPKDEFFNLSPGGHRYKRNTETGEVEEIASAPPKGVDKSLYEAMKTFNVNGKPVWKGLRRDTKQWEEVGPAYIKPNVTNINMPGDYGKDIGEVSEGIKKVSDVKNAKWLDKTELARQGYDWKGGDLGGAYVLDGKLYYSDKELNDYKENVKAPYVSNAVKMSHEQGLDNAVEELRKGIESYKNKHNGKIDEKALDDRINKFKEKNPDLSPDDENILRNYFHLLIL